MHNASNNQMLKHKCNQLQNAITRSGIFSERLEPMCKLVNIIQVFSRHHDRAIHSNIEGGLEGGLKGGFKGGLRGASRGA